MIEIRPCKDTNKRTGERCASSRKMEKYVNEITLAAIAKQVRIDWEKRD